eukprot:5455186-Prymnesium_polylepis.1
MGTSLDMNDSVHEDVESRQEVDRSASKRLRKSIIAGLGNSEHVLRIATPTVGFIWCVSLVRAVLSPSIQAVIANDMPWDMDMDMAWGMDMGHGHGTWTWGHGDMDMDMDMDLDMDMEVAVGVEGGPGGLVWGSAVLDA